MDFLSQFSFEELLFISSIGLIILISIFSIIRYVKLNERIPLVMRHLAGFSVGLLDQLFMILFNFQPEFLEVVLLFDYAAYCFWFMFIPNFLKYKKKYLLIALWVIGSAIVNTIFEHSSLIFLTGGLNYPTQPVVWTSLHTIIFYLCMHVFGTLLILLGFKYAKE